MTVCQSSSDIRIEQPVAGEAGVVDEDVEVAGLLDEPRGLLGTETSACTARPPISAASASASSAPLR